MTKDVEVRSVRCENGDDAALLYRIVEEETDCWPNYGVEIVMRRAGRTERAAVCSITQSYERIRELISLLSENTVTPCTLLDVVDDTLNNF